MELSLVELSQFVIAGVALYGVYERIRKSPGRIFGKSISDFYYKFADEIKRESENILLGRPKTRERAILIAIPILGFILVYWMIRSIVSDLVSEKDVLLAGSIPDALFVYNNGEKGMALLMYLSMILFIFWLVGMESLKEITAKISKERMLSFKDKIIISIFDSVIIWLVLSTCFVAVLYSIGQYLLYQQKFITSLNVPVGVLLFLILYLGYVFVSYTSHKKRLIAKLKYILAFSGDTKLPKVRIMLKNGRIFTGFLVPFYSDKNIVVIASPERDGLKINNVLKYIPWGEISIFELTEE